MGNERSGVRGRAASGAQRPGTRERAAQQSYDTILRAAIKVFAKHGFHGGSIDKISKAAKSYDRMIYYYFGSKEKLFIAVLEEIYRKFDDAESRIQVSTDDPVKSLKTIIQFIFEYHQNNSEFITLLNTENLHRGKHVSKSRAREFSYRGVSAVDSILKSGVKLGIFRENVVARDVYLMIVSMGYFYQSNRFTLSAFLGENLESRESIDHWLSFMIDAVMRTIASEASVREKKSRKSMKKVPLANASD